MTNYVFTPIDQVWSSHRMRFGIVQGPNRLFIGYYDSNRQLSVASRSKSAWVYHRLQSWTGWDSHNHIALGLDVDGCLHVAGNMHGDPLNYYRTRSGDDVRTLERISRLISPESEKSITYPAFLRDPAGDLIFRYRSGVSGAATDHFVSCADGSFRSLHGGPLIDGEGLRSAYVEGPVPGPDGRFHMVWLWRDTPDAATNHSLSYARSPDLKKWEWSDGQELAVPIRFQSSEIVDPAPPRSGVLNGNVRIGFDASCRPVVTYFKFDREGRTQVHLARREKQGWRLSRITDWPDFRWDFGGGGTLPEARLEISPVVPADSMRLSLSVIRDSVASDLIVNAESLELVAEKPSSRVGDIAVAAKGKPEGMEMQSVTETWSGSRAPFSIVWPALKANRDLPADEIRPPTTLWLATPCA